MFQQPKTIHEALRLRSKYLQDITPIAGGTDLVVGIRKGRLKITSFLDLSLLDDWKHIEELKTEFKIGSLVTHCQLEKFEINVLAQAARTVGGPQIRNRGTIGGQIGTASPAGDVNTALIALKAEVELSSLEGTRRVPLSDFFLSPGKNCANENELISAIFIPKKRDGLFYKIGKRNAVAISLIMVAVTKNENGELGIGIGCAAPTPVFADSLEQVNQVTSPITDHRGSSDYRKKMAYIIAQRLIGEIS